MLKILIFSDTHNETTACADIIMQNPDAAAVIHAGDCVRDAEDIAAMFPNITVYRVKGNNDFFTRAPETLTVTVGGRRIFVTHGHMHNVKYEATLYTLKTAAREANAELAIYGHTHKPSTEYDGGLTILNPGSVRFTKTYAIAEINGGKLKTEILKI